MKKQECEGKYGRSSRRRRRWEEEEEEELEDSEIGRKEGMEWRESDAREMIRKAWREQQPSTVTLSRREI